MLAQGLIFCGTDAMRPLLLERQSMADSDMLKAAEAEVERLEAELAATPAFQKLQLAKQVVALYREDKTYSAPP